MKLAEATRLVGRLKNAFPRMTLDEPEMELIITEVALLADPLILNAAVDRIIRTSERFPTIAEIRAQYRASNEARTTRLPALPGARTDIPEWVHVWFWQMQRTRTARQAARQDTRQKVEDRAPLPLRDFPQFEEPGPDAFTLPEYEDIRTEWTDADSPKIGAVAEILSVI